MEKAGLNQKVVAVIGDSTFLHSGITPLIDAVYNQSKITVLILDNSTTAMTGHQEHPGTGRTLDHHATGKVRFEDLARSMGISRVHVVDPTLNPDGFRVLVQECLDSAELALIIARRNCLLAAGQIREYEKCEEKSD